MKCWQELDTILKNELTQSSPDTLHPGNWGGEKKKERHQSRASWDPGSEAVQKDRETSRHLCETFSAFVCSPLLLSAVARECAEWHSAPVRPGCCNAAVKCDAFCCVCALRLVLFGWGGIRLRALLRTHRRGDLYYGVKCLLALFNQTLIWKDRSCQCGLRDKRNRGREVTGAQETNAVEILYQHSHKEKLNAEAEMMMNKYAHGHKWDLFLWTVFDFIHSISWKQSHGCIKCNLSC